MLAFSAIEAGFISSIIVALLAAVPGALAYRRGKEADARTSDLDTLREIVQTLQEENNDQRQRITQLSGRLDQCEQEKNDLKARIFDLHLEVIRSRPRDA